jgi:VIT1/CCC1 family predicted Fe2+/Mn2+ transporter
VENFLEGEKEEMMLLYEKRGLSRDNAKVIVDILAKDPKVFTEIMVVEELNIMPTEDSSAAMDGFATFVSFLIFGFCPAIPYLVTIADKSIRGPDGVFGASCGVTVFVLLVLGFMQAKITRQPLVKGSLLMLFNGVLAACVAYVTGLIVKKAVGRDIKD